MSIFTFSMRSQSQMHFLRSQIINRYALIDIFFLRLRYNFAKRTAEVFKEVWDNIVSR
jgi:hypothetical protein